MKIYDMKKLFAVLFIISSLSVFGQRWDGHASGFVGLLNLKARVQYELPISKSLTTGANLNYYFVNWTGPLLEPFIRAYGRNGGNEEGWFFQAKLGYGNLKRIDIYDLNDETESARWSTFGGGLAIGNKIIFNNNITMEPLIGFRIYSSPNINEYETNDDIYEDAMDLGEDVGWYLTTGLPLDFQFKIGYQF